MNCSKCKSQLFRVITGRVDVITCQFGEPQSKKAESSVIERILCAVCGEEILFEEISDQDTQKILELIGYKPPPIIKTKKKEGRQTSLFTGE